MESLQVPEDRRAGLLQTLVRRNFVELEHRLHEAGLSDADAELLLSVPQRRGGPELLTDAPAAAVEAVTGMRRVYELLDAQVAERVIFDLGLIRNIGYYTGAVFEVYDPAIGAPIGGGGRYDELLGRFGRVAAGRRLCPVRRLAAPGAGGRGTRNRRARGAALGRRRAGRMSADQRPDDRRSPRRAVRRDGRSADGARGGHRGAALQRPQAAVRGHRRRDMRPSDVPTYVEAGAADLGVTGKDVLLEQTAHGPEEARSRRVRAARSRLRALHDGARREAGPDPALESLRRLGVMRVATKYPRIAERHLEQTGRQGEIVEVKGSVELAPLTGMVEAIVDLTATGTTLRENNLVVREEIVVCTARLIANPVSHKLKAAQIDALLGQLRGLTAASAA